MDLIVFLFRLLVTVYITESIAWSYIRDTALELPSSETKAKLHYEQIKYGMLTLVLSRRVE
jgi:hypothetical protein